MIAASVMSTVEAARFAGPDELVETKKTPMSSTLLDDRSKSIDGPAPGSSNV